MEIVTEAVQLLTDKNESEGEVSLNRKLYQSVIATYGMRVSRGEHIPDCAPAFDAPNPPMTPDVIPSEKKRPDLRWDLVDHQMGPEYIRSFAVECKRLHGPSSSGWEFNEKYASNGVARFVNESHRYGENMSSGAMIGYWQNMSRNAILADVNSALSLLGLPEILFNSEQAGLLHQTDHMLVRSFAVSPYRLRHLWLDMRAETAVVEADAAGVGKLTSESQAVSEPTRPEDAGG